mgnify:CR=1 FL=1
MLITTLFRLGLNISTTRQILGNNGHAGAVIQSFGNMITQGNIVLGTIMTTASAMAFWRIRFMHSVLSCQRFRNL